jgi:DNA primase
MGSSKFEKHRSSGSHDFDLDPAPDVAFDVVKNAALDLRRRLNEKRIGKHIEVHRWEGTSRDGAAPGEK